MPSAHITVRIIAVAVAIVGALSLAGAPAAAQSASTPAPEPTSKPRPRIALVLSGGGARGFAHIGVLRVLQELRVPVDFVVGTSMGSVVGGAYAAGTSVDDLEQLVHRTDWDYVIADRPPRDELTFRRREEDLLLPSRIEFGATFDGVSAPPSAAGNAALERALTRVLPAGTRDTPVNQLSLPFRSVASDLVTGELVQLDDTPLFLTMRASLAVPGVFAPVRIKHHLVVDGGLVRNLPIDIARAMGADIVIAVNVGTPLGSEKELGSEIGVAQQMLRILTEQNVQRSLAELRPDDVLISPQLNGISFLDFQRHDQAIEAGEDATRALAARLQQLALPEDDYAAYESHRLAAPAVVDVAQPLLALGVSPSGHINPEALKAQSGLVVGKPVTLDQARQAGDKLYGRGDLARVETDVTETPGGRVVQINPTEADWARSRLRVGLELASDFNDNNTFALKLMHVLSSVNDWGAELRTTARIGSERDFSSEFWQPLGAGSPWYVAPSLAYTSYSSDVFSQGLRTSRIGVNGASATLAFGRQLGSGGDLQVGITRAHDHVLVTIPQQQVDAPVQRVQDTTQFIRWREDTLDSVAFPTRGVLIDSTLQRSLSGAGQQSLASSQLQAMAAFHTGQWAGHVYGEWARSSNGAAPDVLGGFLRLSGTPPESVQGRSIVLGRIVTARAIGSMPAPLGGVVRLGFSAELGGGYDTRQDLHLSTLKQAGSAFVAVDTRFGPLYFGAGATKGGDGTLYLFLGPIW